MDSPINPMSTGRLGRGSLNFNDFKFSRIFNCLSQIYYCFASDFFLNKSKKAWCRGSNINTFLKVMIDTSFLSTLPGIKSGFLLKSYKFINQEKFT